MDKKDQKEDPKVNFTGFVSGLLAEGFMALGIMKHPDSGKEYKNLRHAGLVIDTLAMLKEKTAGNLTNEETDSLEEVMHQLRLAYIAEMNKKEENKDEKGRTSAAEEGESAKKDGENE
jgi:hypothetical protein